MDKKPVILDIVGDECITCALDMTEAECEVVERFLSTAVREGKYAPSIFFENPWKEERRRIKAEAEAKAADEAARLADLRVNGPIAVAYRKAMENKRTN